METPENIEVQALEKISSEVGDSQIKVILSTQCIKAQRFLTGKLKKEIKHLKETCENISNANLKVQSEISQAELKIQSLITAEETIKMANVELKKECLLAKVKKVDIAERVKNGERKYEDMWEECKSRYETLPFVKELLKATEKTENLKNDLKTLDNEALAFIEQLDTKTKKCYDLDRKRIIELAEFLVHELPKANETIIKKRNEIDALVNELNKFEIDANKATLVSGPNKKCEESKQDVTPDGEWAINSDSNDTFKIPKLTLPTFDFDTLTETLDEVKIKKATTFTYKDNRHGFEIGTAMFNTKYLNKEKINNSCFNKSDVINENIEIENFSQKKLINILEDIKIDANDAMNLIAKLNPDKFQSVDTIEPEPAKNNEMQQTSDINMDDENPSPVNNTTEKSGSISNTENILNPPTPFLDTTAIISENDKDRPQENEKNLEENNQEIKDDAVKEVSFDVPSLVLTGEGRNEEADNNGSTEDVGNETVNSQLEVSAVSDDGLAMIKEMVLKKHNLDSSPQFVYAKNTMLQMQKTETNIVTSKFFQNNVNESKTNNKTMETTNLDEKETVCNEPSEKTNRIVSGNKKVIEMDVDTGVSNPKRPKLMEIPEMDKPISGLLFQHGIQDIPESLDVSISTTGFDDGDTEFPHCIDSSLLLSPKADIPMSENAANTDIISQEAPNFLTGLRKTGLSFFGKLSSSEPKSDSNAQNQGSSGFNFNFGADEKKTRGGIFSLFQ